MYGGLGIFEDGLMFAHEGGRCDYPAYAAEGSGPFVHAGMRGKGDADAVLARPRTLAR
jgi:hypothetical protein